MESEEDIESAKKHKIPVSVYSSEGLRFLHEQQYEIAIPCFSKVIDEKENDIRCLLARAKCLFRLGKFEKAYKDVEAVLKHNPNHPDATILKCDVEYVTGDFEKSLITSMKGSFETITKTKLKLRERLNADVITNCLQPNFQLQANDVAKMEQSLNSKGLKITVKGDGQCKGQSFLHSEDLKFLDVLMDDKYLSCVRSPCRDLSNYLKDRKIFWQSSASTRSRKLKNVRSDHFRNPSHDTRSKVGQAYGSGKDTQTSAYDEIRRCRKCLKLFNGKPNIKPMVTNTKVKDKSKKYLRSKDFVVENLLKNICKDCALEDAFLNSENRRKSIDSGKYIDREAVLHKGETYFKDEHFSKAFECYQQSLNMTTFAPDKADLLYKMADCHVRTKNFDTAHDLAMECLFVATSSKNSRCQFDAMILLAEIATQKNDPNDAEQHYRDALRIAVENNDSRQHGVRSLLEFFPNKNIENKDKLTSSNSNINKRIPKDEN